jgi:two-component system cell cycle response regulator DivK
MTILIADDNPKNLEYLRTVLTSLGHKVIEASNGQETLDRLEETRPDAAILDLQMPLLDGFATIAAIRANAATAHLPAAALTAFAMEQDRERAKEAGFTAFWTKPISLASLRRNLDGLLEGRPVE